MAIVKCPRCDINFIREEDGYCPICKREMKGEAPKEDIADMCIECGEHPAAPGEELCVYCLGDRKLADKAVADTSAESDDVVLPDPDAIDLDIEIVPLQADDIEDDDIAEDIPEDEREEIHKELGFDEDIDDIDDDSEPETNADEDM